MHIFESPYTSLTMRLICLFLLLPLFAASQNGNEYWTTPIADVKFNEGKIVYTIAANDQPGYERLRPVYYNPSILSMSSRILPFIYDGENIRKINEQTLTYLESWQPGSANNRDKYIFLEHCVIRILWFPAEKPSPHILEVVAILKDDLSVDISHSARLVHSLYEDYKH